eukprot:3267132-Pyramimonas_sp.AAC.1
MQGFDLSPANVGPYEALDDPAVKGGEWSSFGAKTVVENIQKGVNGEVIGELPRWLRHGGWA